jgi:hypothetical protein
VKNVYHLIVVFVIAVHLLFVIVMIISPPFIFQKKEHKPLIVKTIVPKPASKLKAPEKKLGQANGTPKAVAAVIAPPSPKPSPPQVVAKTTPKPAPQKKPAAKPTTAIAAKKEPAIADKVVSKSKPPVPAKKNPPAQNRGKISDKLLKELEESIAKIENKSDKGYAGKKTTATSRAVAPVHLQIDSLASEDVEESEGASDYTENLVRHLHQSLNLPDYGEVKIQLRLRQDGTVVKIAVIKTESEKNKKYLEERLPALRFPRFEGEYANKKEDVFILTFCNEL